MMEHIPVVLITGHPATGKTTLACYLAPKLGLPLLYKDQIKETLFDTLGYSTVAWRRRLGVAAFNLLYQYVESLLCAGVAHVVKGNFDPRYANEPWQALAQKYPLRVIQLRCETDPETLMRRYRTRIEVGARHPGHVDAAGDGSNTAFYKMVKQGPCGWIAVDGERVTVDTVALSVEDYGSIVEQVRELTENG